MNREPTIKPDKPTSKMLEFLNAPRTLPITGFGLRRVLRKIWSALIAGQLATYRSHALTQGPCTRGEIWRMQMSLIVVCITKMAAFGFVIFPIGTTPTAASDGGIVSVRPAQIANTRWQSLWMTGWAGCGALLYVLPLIGLARPPALIPSFICQFASFCCYWASLRLFAFGTAVIGSMQGGDAEVVEYNVVVNVEHQWYLLVFLIFPASRLARYLLLMILPKKSLEQIMEYTSSVFKRSKSATVYSSAHVTADFIKLNMLPDTDIMTIIGDLDPSDVPGEATVSPTIYASIYEQLEHIGYVRYSSLVFLYLCRHTCVPISFHRNLCNSDVLKSIRLSDFFLHYHYWRLSIHFIISVFAVGFIRDYATIVQAPCTLIVEFSYAIACHAQRLLSLRGFECQQLAEQIVHDYQRSQPEVDQEILSQSEYQLCADAITDGFFSSPGNLFPT